MQLTQNKIKLASIVIGMGIAMSAFAEPAPVYDVDSMPQQFETVEQDQDLPPPPPDQDDSFAPMQSNRPMVQGPMSTEQRIKRLEQQINNMQNTSEASARVESLENQIQSLRGQVEELTHQLQQMQNQQQMMYSDIDKRIANASSAKAVPVQTSSTEDTKNNHKITKQTAKQPATAENETDTPKAKLPDNQPNVAEEQQIYQTAYNLIKVKKYNEAVSVLQNMLQKYPSGQFASNAHYWLGELYGLLGKNDQALNEFGTVVKNYPDSPRISDAQLKVGLIYAAQFKWADAKLAFKRVINHYPGTTSARLASEQLKQIKQAGH